MGFVDRKLKCDDCFVEFTFTAGEQEFFLKRDLLNLKDANCVGRRRSPRVLKKGILDID
jgi:hypothetical protein